MADAVRSVDADGVLLNIADDRVLDVLFDDRRVWSFWSKRDTVRTGSGSEVRAEWPRPLRRFLDGRTRLSIRETVSGAVLFDAEVAFGEKDERIAVTNKQGRELSLDKDGRLIATFEQRSEEHTKPLLDAIEEVLGVLSDLGVDAFLAYGTLLGAVREGNLLGHDSDADLGYVSSATTPVDVVRESLRLQRGIVERGYQVQRYSGAAFKVFVAEGDGFVRGLDVFGGFFDGDRLYLMGEVGHEFRREWIWPLGRSALADRMMPTPARPEHLLEAMYGPGWRVPDPAFKFTKDAHTQARLNGWFRGITVGRREWDRAFSARRRRLPRYPPSELARLAHEELPKDVHVLDVGAGRGRDAMFLARQGRTVTAYDYLPDASTAALEWAQKNGLALDVRALNLLELRSVLGEGVRLAQHPGPRAVLAVHCMDATPTWGVRGLLRFAAMTLGGGGRLYADFYTSIGDEAAGETMWPVSLERASLLAESHGARIISAAEDEVARPNGGSARRGRLVAQWA